MAYYVWTFVLQQCGTPTSTPGIRMCVHVYIHIMQVRIDYLKILTMSFLHKIIYIQIYMQIDFCVRGSVTICMETICVPNCMYTQIRNLIE